MVDWKFVGCGSSGCGCDGGVWFGVCFVVGVWFDDVVICWCDGDGVD